MFTAEPSEGLWSGIAGGPASLSRGKESSFTLRGSTCRLEVTSRQRQRAGSICLNGWKLKIRFYNL